MDLTDIGNNKTDCQLLGSSQKNILFQTILSITDFNTELKKDDQSNYYIS